MPIIHMNGRTYDYNLGRFLSVDPVIQAPTNSQSLNPYSYIMNNPLSGTDPTGYMGECPTGSPECNLGESEPEPEEKKSDRLSSAGKCSNGHACSGGISNGSGGTASLADVQSAIDKLGSNAQNSPVEGAVTIQGQIDGVEPGNSGFFGRTGQRFRHLFRVGRFNTNQQEAQFILALSIAHSMGPEAFSNFVRANPLFSGTRVLLETLASLGTVTTIKTLGSGTVESAESTLNGLVNLIRSSGARPPATAIGAVDSATGRIVAATSGEVPSNIHPALLELAEQVGGLGVKTACGNTLGRCAEFRAANALLQSGSNLSDIVFTNAVRPRNGMAIPRCENCINIFGRE